MQHDLEIPFRLVELQQLPVASCAYSALDLNPVEAPAKSIRNFFGQSSHFMLNF